jgi:hypothetical protein
MMTDNGSIKLEFQYDQKEFTVGMRDYLLPITLTVKKRDWVLASLFLVVVVGVLVLTGDLPFWLPVVAVIFILGVLTFYNGYIVPLLTWRRQPTLADRYSVEFSDEGVQCNTSTTNTQMQWQAYQRVIETKQYYYLVLSKFVVSVIPKRVFSSAQEEAAFRELIKRNLPNSLI